MGDSSRTQLRYMEEVTWGVIPAIALKDTRATGEGLDQVTDTIVSQEIRADRNVTDVIRAGIRAEGPVPLELSYAAHDDLIAGAMMAAWSTAITTSATTIGASNVNSRFDATVIDWTTEDIEVGQWIKVGGFVANSGHNNGFYKVTSISATQLGVIPAPLSDEAATPTVTVKGSLVKNGTTKKSFVLEKEFADITEFVSFTGMRVGQFSINIQPGQILTGEFSFLGKQATAAAATVGTGAPTAAPANDVLNAVDNIQAVFEGGVLSTLDVTQIAITINNNLRGKPAVGNLANVDIGLGRAVVTGTFAAYFESRTLYDKYLNNTVTALAIQVADAAGNTYVFDLPKVEFTAGRVVAGGPDQDVIAELTFQAKRDTVGGYTYAINRIAA